MDAAKEEFLKEFGQDYGYPSGPKSINELRATEFKRLQDLVYLDHAGATLYSDEQMGLVFKDLTGNVYGNPPCMIFLFLTHVHIYSVYGACDEEIFGFV